MFFTFFLQVNIWRVCKVLTPSKTVGKWYKKIMQTDITVNFCNSGNSGRRGKNNRTGEIN